MPPRRRIRPRQLSKVPPRRAWSLDDVLNKNPKRHKSRPKNDDFNPWRRLMELQLPIHSRWLNEIYTPIDLTSRPGCLTLAYNVSIENEDEVPDPDPAVVPAVVPAAEATDDAESEDATSQDVMSVYSDMQDELDDLLLRAASLDDLFLDEDRVDISRSDSDISIKKEPKKSATFAKQKTKKKFKFRRVFRVNPKIARVFKKTRKSIHMTNADLRKYNSFFNRVKRLICCKTSSLLGYPGPRSPNPTSYVQVIRDRLAAKRVPQGRKEARQANILAFDRILMALRYLTYIQDSSEFATKILSYDRVYIERDLNSEEKKLTKGKSILGGYMWMCTYIIGLISSDSEISTHIKSIVKLRIEDVVGSGILLWAAVVHEVETIRSCLNLFENAIIKFIFSLKAPEDERNESENAPQSDVNPDKLHRVRRKKWKMKHDAEVKARYADMYIWRGKRNVKRPEAKVFTRVEKGTWTALENQRELVDLILLTSSRILQIIEDELTQLSSLDKWTQGVVPPLNELENPSNFLEATLLMEKALYALHQFPNNLLKQPEVDDLKEVGRIVLDRLDVVYGVLEDMQAMAFEASHLIQICYEYTRVYYNFSMTEFDDFGDVNHKKYLSLWAHSPEFKVAMPPDSLINPLPFFNGSSYPDILKTIFVSADKRELCLGEINEDQPSAAFRARDLQIKENKIIPSKKQDSVPSISLSGNVDWD